LSADHEVDAIAFGAAAGSAEIARLVRRVAIVPPPRHRSAIGRALDLARSELPDMALRRFSSEFMATVRCFVRDGDYAAVQAEGIEMATYLDAVPPAQRIYDAHNAEFLLQRRFASTASSPSARLYSTVQWRRLERFERVLVGASRLTLAVSQHDANQLAALAGPAANVRVVRNGVDAAAFTPALPGADQPPNLLFLGKLDF